MTDSVFDQVDDGLFDETRIAADTIGILGQVDLEFNARGFGFRARAADGGCRDVGEDRRFELDSLFA